METTELTLVTLDTAERLGLTEEEFDCNANCLNFGNPYHRTIGEGADGEITVDGSSFGNIAEWRQLYVNAFDTYLEN